METRDDITEFDFAGLAAGLNRWYLEVDAELRVTRLYSGSTPPPFGDPTGSFVWDMLASKNPDDPRLHVLRETLRANLPVRDLRFQRYVAGPVFGRHFAVSARRKHTRR